MTISINNGSYYLIVSIYELLYSTNILGWVKNLNHTITEVPERTELVNNFTKMTDDVMIWRHKILRNEGLTRPGLFIMSFVSNKGPLKLTDCSTSLGVSKPTVTKIVDNLEKDGFVKRMREGEDRRNYYVHLTEQGRERLETLNKQVEDVFYNATKDLKIEDVKALNTLIPVVRDKLRSISKQN